MRRIGVIEIGANSVTLTLNEVEDDGYFRPIDELNTSIRLCQDLVYGDKLSPDKLNTALSTLRTFKSMCKISCAEKIIAIATEDYRNASNSSMLFKLIKDELGIDITVLDIEKEIYFNFLGVSNTTYFDNYLLVDIEGLSTHLAWVKDGEIKNCYSLPVGTLNLTYEYELQDRILNNNIENAKSKIISCLKECTWIKYCDSPSIVGVGGTIKCLSKIDRSRKRYPLDIEHNYNLNDIDVQEIYNLLKCKCLKQRYQVYGLPNERADIMVAGLCILNNIQKYSGITNLVTSSKGLSEGIMYKYIDEHYDYEKDMLTFSLKGIMNKLNINKNHAKNVYNLAMNLFENLRPIHKLNDNYKKILKTAALLHDCGISIDYYNHHKHSFYVILNSSINGLSHKDLLISATVAASHRNNSYHIPYPQFSSIINRIDINAIEYLGSIIKISESLDRSLGGAVKELIVDILPETVVIKLKSPLDLELEIRQAMRSSYSFKQIYGKDLSIEKID
ncbi:Ppx/GppA phosphatase family protein [Clostridium sp.]|uniref:Ppx/GppA phosphatase family protein n=1 Tax=Clostridium sp. TaxID=1506 RepID=UPI0026DC2A29|nr:Ppx/GppA phosphatase family protein [Clostridium sp.]MDO5038939.1 Ppx/GppA phosphatase family protein [Clostridium sp.]